MSNIYAIIQNGMVVNTIEYENEPSNPPPGFDETYSAVLANGASIGWTYANGLFTAPPVPIEVQNMLDALQASLSKFN